MGTKRRASATVNADHGEAGFQIHVHRIDWTGLRAFAASNTRIPSYLHTATLALPECVCGASFYARCWIAPETDLRLESSAQTARRADSNPASMPRQTLVQHSRACEGAGIAPNAAFHSGGAKYFHDHLPSTETRNVSVGFEYVLFHWMWLTCAGEHIAPESSIGLYFLPSSNGQRNGYVCEPALPAADNHVGSPGHCRMNRVVSEHQAKSGVVRTRRHASNRITWINVLEV